MIPKIEIKRRIFLRAIYLIIFPEVSSMGLESWCARNEILAVVRWCFYSLLSFINSLISLIECCNCSFVKRTFSVFSG